MEILELPQIHNTFLTKIRKQCGKIKIKITKQVMVAVIACIYLQKKRPNENSLGLFDSY